MAKLKENSKEIFSYRLRSARKIAGLSFQQLSDMIGGRVSKQALSKYEQGVMLPDIGVVERLSEVLDVSKEYFFREPTVTLKGIEFRKKSNMQVREIESIKAKVIDHLERYFELENLLNIKSFFVNPLKEDFVSTSEEVELAAQELRRVWELGLAPVHNLVEVLEDRYVKIYQVDGSETFDGLSGWVDQIPIIVVNRQTDIVRKRLTLMHELGHILLTLPPTINSKQKEKVCFNFASAVLLPGLLFNQIFGANRTTFSQKELVQIEEHFGISCQAIMVRAKNLNLISDHTYRQFFMWLSRSGNRKKTLGNYNGIEESLRFWRLIARAVSENIISENKGADLAGMSLSKFKEEFRSRWND